MAGKPGRSGRHRLSIAHHLRAGTYRPDRHGPVTLSALAPVPDPRPPTWLLRGLRSAGRAHVRGFWAEFTDLGPGDLQLLRLSAECLDRIAALQASIKATGGPADSGGKAHGLLRHVRSEATLFAGLMRPLTPRAEAQ